MQIFLVGCLPMGTHNKNMITIHCGDSLPLSFADINLSWPDLQIGKVLERFDFLCCNLDSY